MNQKAVLISGLVLVAIIVVLSFAVEVESSPSGDSILFLGRHTNIVIPNCVDSDSGFNYAKRGYITNRDGIFHDSCAKDNRYVLEQYCRGEKRGVMQHNCKFGCELGKCKNEGRRIGISPEGPGTVQ